MNMTPKQAIDSILEQAPAILKEDKHHAPVLFVFGEKENAVILIKFTDSDSKHMAMLDIGRKMAHLGPYCIAFVSEAWMAKRMPTKGKEIHDMPDKQECLQVTAQNKEGVTEGAAIPFSRIGGDILLGETMYAPYTESYLFNLFWKGVSEGS